MLEQLAMQLVAPLSVGALFLYVRSIKSDVRELNVDFKHFGDNCRIRHEDLIRKSDIIERLMQVTESISENTRDIVMLKERLAYTNGERGVK